MSEEKNLSTVLFVSADDNPSRYFNLNALIGIEIGDKSCTLFFPGESHLVKGEDLTRQLQDWVRHRSFYRAAE